jgi:histidine triad (HIT) family protein
VEDCVFCRIVRGDIPAQKVLETGDVLAFDDINPTAPVHVVVVPKKHIATLNDADEADARCLGALLLAAKAVAAAKGLVQDGYRSVINTMPGAGQVVLHVHMHVIGGRELDWPPG